MNNMILDWFMYNLGFATPNFNAQDWHYLQCGLLHMCINPESINTLGWDHGHSVVCRLIEQKDCYHLRFEVSKDAVFYRGVIEALNVVNNFAVLDKPIVIIDYTC